jgi:hypothetical protein
VAALDDPGDIGAADADIGERAVVERHQLGISQMPAPPLGEALAGGDEQIDDKHRTDSSIVMVHCTNG